MPIFNMINQKSFEYAKIGRFEDYNVAEIRAQNARFADPLTLNFKLIINYDKPYGLFAPETEINSALAYLQRIGQDTRYEMLKNWIETFKILIKNFDFLFLSAEGFDTIVGHNPSHIFTDEDKLTFIVREPSDMLVQALLTNYKEIMFDSERGVEVVPINLRRFDFSLLVFASGYYNMLYYDNQGFTDELDRLIFPTVRKLSTEVPDYKAFHHIMFDVEDAWFNMEESGKNFFQTLNNEQSSDFIKNNMVFNFKRAKYSGQFNAISGSVNYAALLAMTHAYDKITESAAQIKKSLGDRFKEIGKSTTDLFKTRVNQIEDKVLSKNSVIGDIWGKVSSLDYAQSMVKNTAALGINNVFSNYIDNPLTKINNVANFNFGNNIYELIANNTQQKSNNVRLLETPAQESVVNNVNFAQESATTPNGVKIRNYNVYRR